MFSLETSFVTFKDKALVVLLSWMVKHDRISTHGDIWKEVSSRCNAALANTYKQLEPKGTTTKTFILAHRFEVQVFLSNRELQVMMSEALSWSSTASSSSIGNLVR